MNISKLIKYPSLEYSRQLYPNERIILGRFLVWTEKRDGCLHSDTKIITNKGLLRVNNVIKKKDDILVLTYNWKRNEFEYQPILSFVKRQHTHPFVMVRIKQSKKNSYTVTVTNNHLFATKRGWIEAQHLRSGDEVFLIGNEIPYLQQQVILGTILGDGSIYSRASENCGFTIAHSEPQWEYLFLKKKLLGDLVRLDKHSYRGGYDGSKLEKRIISPINLEITSLLKEFCLIDGKKNVTSQWVNKLSPIALAFWYMDDGSFDSHVYPAYGYATFHTQSYTEEECSLLIDMFKDKFNIDAKRRKDGAIHLNTESSKIFFNLIAPYVPVSMQYKLPKHLQTKQSYWDTYIFPLESFQLIPNKIVGTHEPKKWKHVTLKSNEYDIETANHNYFADGVLVHNSNIRCYLDENDDIQFGSRNMRRASLDLLQSIKNTGYIDILNECLKEEEEKWKLNLIIFFELLQHGKSPTHMEFHKKDDIVIFDIYSLENGWLSYNRIHQMCKMYNFPIVELWGTSIHSDIQSFKKFENDMLEIAKKNEREGVVGKHYHGFDTIFFKNRIDLPDIRNVITHFDDGRIELPLLPIPEIRGAVHKAYIDLGKEKFLDKKISMPIIANYVKDECHKHLCSMPKNLFGYYLEKISDL